MAKNFLLDVLSASATPIDHLILPSLVWQGSVTKMTNGEFRITNLGKASKTDLTTESFVLLMSAGSSMQVKLKHPINKSATGNEYHFVSSIKKRDQCFCDVYQMTEIPIYRFDDWKSKNQIRYTNASIASKKLRYQFNPVNKIVEVLNTVEDWCQYWQEVKSGKREMPALNGDGEVVTKEVVEQQLKEWEFLQQTLSDVSEYAVNKNLTVPIDEDKYTIELRSIKIVLICAALDLENSELFDKMTVEQIDSVWGEITNCLNSESVQPTSESEPKKNTPTHGKKTKTDSTESATKSEPLSEPESTPSENVETLVLEN